MATYNNGLMDYGYSEEKAFEGVMPKVAEKVGTVGASDVVIGKFDIDAKGMDALEVIDLQAAFDSSEDSGEGNGDASESGSTVDGE